MAFEEGSSDCRADQRRNHLWFRTLFAKSYFFKGAIISQSKDKEQLYQLVDDEKRDILTVMMNHLMLQTGRLASQENDFSQCLSDDILELLIFSIERHQVPLQ